MKYITPRLDALIITNKDISKILTPCNKTLFNDKFEFIMNRDKILITEVNSNIFMYFLKYAHIIVIEDGFIEFATCDNNIVTQIKIPRMNRIESPITLNAKLLFKIFNILKPKDKIEIYKVNPDNFIYFKTNDNDIVFVVEDEEL